MDGRRARGAVGRAIIGVIALYGLLLQLFFVSLAPLPAFGADGHAICAPDPATTSRQDDGAPTSHHGQTCCTLACASALPPVAPQVGVAFVRPPREAVLVAWADADAHPPTGPPIHSTSARGPPVA